MEKIKNIPKIRFKGYKDHWEKKELRNITKYSNGDSYEGSVCNNGKYELINLNSISIDGGLKSSHKYVNHATKSLSKNDLVMVLSDVAHGYLLGRVALIPKDDSFVLNQRVASLSIFDDTNPDYLMYFINNNQLYFKEKGAGSSQLNLSKSVVEDFTVYIPSNKEQKQIGSLFKNLDEKLEIEREKHEKLMNFKKAMLENVFPKEGEKRPKIRFGGYNDDWEDYKIKNLLSYEQPSNYIVKSDKYKTSGIPVLTANKSFILGYTNEEKTYNKGECIIFDDFTMDFKYVDFEFKVKSSALKILTSKESELYFLNELLQSLKLEPESHKRHYIGYVQELVVSIPSINEQKLIGSFFKNLDEKIQVSEEKISKIENFKKAMMNGLFV